MTEEEPLPVLLKVPPMIEPWQQRMVVERDQLYTRLSRLEAYITGPTFHTLDKEEQRRLGEQSKAMLQYLSILDDRIEFARLKKEP